MHFCCTLERASERTQHAELRTSRTMKGAFAAIGWTWSPYTSQVDRKPLHSSSQKV